MAVSINWGTLVIFVPKADTTLVGTDPISGREVRQYDVNVFRLALKELEAGVEGMNFLDTHRHNTEVTLSGVTYARFVEIINGYRVEFEDGPYAVNLFGANHNIVDVNVINQVQLRSSNSAGLIVAGSGVTTPDIEAIADAVWDEVLAGHSTVGSTGEALSDAQTGSSPASIADAVWDEALSGHLIAGSTGESLNNQDVRIKEVWQLLGIDPGTPVTVSKVLNQVGSLFNISITDNGNGTVTLQRS